jgi:Mg2+/Co2+ transporter CorB
MLLSLLVLLMLSGFFAGSETALMAISRLRLAHLARAKPRRASIVEGVLKKPERLIGTILLGNNLVNVAMSAIATSLAITLWGDKGIAYVTVILTIVILIFADITPKVYAKYFCERVSLLSAPIMHVLMTVLGPVVYIVSLASNKLLLATGVDVTKIKKPLMTEEDIRTCIKLGWDEGTISAQEKQLLSRVFTLNDKTVGDIMLPKAKMAVLQIDMAIEEVVRTVIKAGYSRFPVTKGKASEIVGFIHAKDLFQIVMDKKGDGLQKMVRPPSFVGIDEKISAQLRTFQFHKRHQSIVLDSQGHVVGLVTLEDIIEELVGSIKDEYDDNRL